MMNNDRKRIKILMYISFSLKIELHIYWNKYWVSKINNIIKSNTTYNSVRFHRCSIVDWNYIMIDIIISKINNQQYYLKPYSSSNLVSTKKLSNSDKSLFRRSIFNTFLCMQETFIVFFVHHNIWINLSFLIFSWSIVILI